jgi:hypothetical protein
MSDKKPKVSKTELEMTKEQSDSTSLMWSAICQVAGICHLSLYDTMAILDTCKAMLLEGSVMALKSEHGPDQSVMIRRGEDHPEGPSEFFNE